MSILDNEAGSRACASKNSAKLVIRVSSGIDGHVHQRRGRGSAFSFRALEIKQGKKIWWKALVGYSSYLLLSSGERPRN